MDFIRPKLRDIMQTPNKKQIVFNVDSEIADLFQKLSEKEKEQFEFLLSTFLRKPKDNFFLRPEEEGWNDLKKRLDSVADTAEEKGLMPEILENILNKE